MEHGIRINYVQLPVLSLVEEKFKKKKMNRKIRDLIVCQGPSYGTMIICDFCNEWQVLFHNNKDSEENVLCCKTYVPNVKNELEIKTFYVIYVITLLASCHYNHHTGI